MTYKTLLICMLVLVSGCSDDNINTINGFDCARNHRWDTDVPFCTNLIDCMKDCNIFHGEFIEVGYRGTNFGKSYVCYCAINGTVTNLW